jgi:hypothetical protein
MKNVGLFLLAIWLVVWGLKAVIGLDFHYDHLVLGILAIAAGVFLILRR